MRVTAATACVLALLTLGTTSNRINSASAVRNSSQCSAPLANTIYSKHPVANASKQVPSAAACCAHCANTSGCVVWTWFENGVCWPETSSADVQTGPAFSGCLLVNGHALHHHQLRHHHHRQLCHRHRRHRHRHHQLLDHAALAQTAIGTVSAMLECVNAMQTGRAFAAA